MTQKEENNMNNPVLQAISERRSIRAYTSEQLSREQIDILLTAALEAPSARNDQPWHFSVVQNQALLEEIREEASKNAEADFGYIFHKAPTVIFISSSPTARWARLDSGIAVQNIALAAHALGLGSVILGLPDFAFQGAKKEYFSKILKFPKDHSFAVAIAVGCPAGTKEAHPILEGRVDFID